MTRTGDEIIISDRLFDLANRQPDKELVFDPNLGRFTYQQVADQVKRLAMGLRGLGLGPGDTIVLQLPNWLSFLVFHLAITDIGAVTVNVPIIYRERELRALLALTKAKALILPQAYGKDDFLPIAELLRKETPSLERLFLVGGDPAAVPAEMISYEDFMETPWERQHELQKSKELRQSPDDLTVLGFTSGTTGELKGAMLSSNTLRAWNMGLVERYGLDENDRIFAGSPLGHAVAFGHCLRMTFTLGASMVLLDHWDAAKALQLIASEKCSFVAGATPFLMDMVYHPELHAHDNLPSLRLFLCGGATVPEKLIEDARDALPHTFVTPLWGMTECGGVTTCPYDAPVEKVLTTDGSPCGSMELKIVDPAGQSVGPGIGGELMARGPMRALGYYERPALTEDVFLPDGYFRTGDQAIMDEDGYIKITGRIKDLVIRGGVNISPVEIENVLYSHPNVINAAVVGMPDPRLGERICAFVVFEDGTNLSLEEVQQWMQHAGVAKPKWPERIVPIPELPMTPSGKIQKFKLREALEQSP